MRVVSPRPVLSASRASTAQDHPQDSHVRSFEARSTRGKPSLRVSPVLSDETGCLFFVFPGNPFPRLGAWRRLDTISALSPSRRRPGGKGQDNDGFQRRIQHQEQCRISREQSLRQEEVLGGISCRQAGGEVPCTPVLAAPLQHDALDAMRLVRGIPETAPRLPVGCAHRCKVAHLHGRRDHGDGGQD